MPEPLVSVIIPAYNSMPYIGRCVESVFSQSLPADRIELIAVDDGSTDGTGAELDRLAATRAGMTVIHQANSGGPSAPRNRGLEAATGEWVYFLDADDYLGPEALERMLRYATENGSEIVVGRMVGVGSRLAAASMFTHDQPNADVFTSRIYWTLGPLKLFSRDLIEREHLRFPEDLHYGDDQPFVAGAYLAARAVSVLTSYDCVFITHREDGSNLTLAGSTLPACLRLSGVMLEFVAERVEPGPKRDHLMRRHFEAEVAQAVERIAEEPDEAVARAACARVRGWVDAYYTARIRTATRPYVRLCIEFASRDMLPELRRVVDAGRSERVVPLVVRDHKAYAAYPLFEEPGSHVDLQLFDATDRVRVNHLVTGAAWRDDEFVVTGTASIEQLGEAEPETALVIAERGTGEEYRVPTSIQAGGAFIAAIRPASAADGRPLPAGVWDLYLEAAAAGISRRARLGCRRSQDVHTGQAHRLVGDAADPLVVTAYYTAPFSNLSLDVGGVKHGVRKPLRVDSLDFGPGPTMQVSGQSLIGHLPTGSVTVRLGDGDTAQEAVAEVDGDAFSATFELPRREAGAMPLALELTVGSFRRTMTVPAATPRTGDPTWWRGLVPMTARAVKSPDGPLVVSVCRRRPLHALVRRLRTRARAKRP